MTEAIATELKRFFEETAPKGVASAYLFGSHSEARSHRESDLDVAVLLDRRVFGTNRERFEERLRLIGAVGSALGRNDVDLVILNEAPPDLGARIVAGGLRVFCSNGRRTAPSSETFSFARPIRRRSSENASWSDI